MYGKTRFQLDLRGQKYPTTSTYWGQSRCRKNAPRLFGVTLKVLENIDESTTHTARRHGQASLCQKGHKVNHTRASLFATQEATLQSKLPKHRSRISTLPAPPKPRTDRVQNA